MGTWTHATRKRLVANQSHCEHACKRTGEVSMTFCGEEEWRSGMRKAQPNGWAFWMECGPLRRVMMRQKRSPAVFSWQFELSHRQLRLTFISRLNTLGLQFNHAYTSVIDTVRIIIFDFICVAEIRRQGESSFLVAKQFFTQTEKRSHVPLRVIFPGDFLY